MPTQPGNKPLRGSRLALALAGDTGQAESLANELARRLPENTLVQYGYLPSVRAQLALNRKDPSRAVQALRIASMYESGASVNAGYTIYLRGQAYLTAHQGYDAAAEFQKILDHPGVVLNDPIAALSHLGLARAYAAQGDSAKAKAAYTRFLTIWKDADPDNFLYQQAKAESAALR